MTCSLVPGTSVDHLQIPATQALCGQMVSSLHRLKDTNNEGNATAIARFEQQRLTGATDGGFFVFGDVSVRLLGRHQLLFSLFELRKENGEVAFLKSITSDSFDGELDSATHDVR